MLFAKITGRADVVAAIDVIAKENYELGEEMLLSVLSKIRWHHEEAGMSPAMRRACRKARAARKQIASANGHAVA
jgi:hypothetical protein